MTLVIGAAAVAVLPAVPAQARACTINAYCVTTWYKDAAKTIVVGQKIEECDGATWQWGSHDAYVTFTETNC